MERAVRILVAIANHGEKNRAFCERLIKTYQSLPHDVSIVVLSDKTKDYGPGVDVLVGAPTDDPWSLPFAHRPLFVSRQDDFDLFIYTEDDTEILERHVDLFVEASAELPRTVVPGFIRFEENPDGEIAYSTVHHVYHWDTTSLLRTSDRVFAHYTNVHAGAYLLTRDQLKRCIASGGFRIDPHETQYDLLVSAATDPYTLCGLQKVVCVSDLFHFALHHLPNVYLDKIGVSRQEFDAQAEVLLRADGENLGRLFNPTTTLGGKDAPWDKRYYEPLRQDILDAIPTDARRVLSVGCDRGLTERHLVARGHEVVGIPIDDVIGAAASLHGIDVTPADLDDAFRRVGEQQFDVILFNASLSYFADPAAVVGQLGKTLRAGGRLVAAFDNMEDLGRWRRWPKQTWSVRARGFDTNGIHWTSPRSVAGWLEASGAKPTDTTFELNGRRSDLARRIPTAMHRFVSPSAVAVAVVS